MAKPVLGKTILSKKVVTNSGLELGEVADIYFETGGVLTSLLVKPDHETKEIKDYIDKNGLVNVPFKEVKAVGRFVVINFPY